MILLDLFFWICDHWEEVTLNGVLLLLLRKFIMSEVHKLLYFNRDEEMKWIRGKIEGLTGEKWNGQQPIWKRAETRYIKTYYLLLRKELKHQRRVSKMKEYLKKLGRTKFQVYIVFSICNIYTLFATLSGHTNISTELDPYMPAINILAQVVGNWVYTHYQGKVDVVTAQNGGVADVIPPINTESNK